MFTLRCFYIIKIRYKRANPFVCVRRGRFPPARSLIYARLPSAPVLSSLAIRPPTPATKSPQPVGCVPDVAAFRIEPPSRPPVGGAQLKDGKLVAGNAHGGIRLKGFCRSMVVASPMLRQGYAVTARSVYGGEVRPLYPLVKGQAFASLSATRPLDFGGCIRAVSALVVRCSVALPVLWVRSCSFQRRRRPPVRLAPLCMPSVGRGGGSAL